MNSLDYLKRTSWEDYYNNGNYANLPDLNSPIFTTTTGGSTDNIMPAPVSQPISWGSTGTTLSWTPQPTLEEQMTEFLPLYLKKHLKLKVEDCGNELMINVMLDDEIIASDFFMK